MDNSKIIYRQRRASDSLFLKLSSFSKYQKFEQAGKFPQISIFLFLPRNVLKTIALLVMAFTILPKEVKKIRDLFNELDSAHVIYYYAFQNEYITSLNNLL